MGLLLIILGVILWLFVSPIVGLVLVVVGVVLLFVPGPFYGYSYWNGWRSPPP
jgi:hypothetical protein